MVTVNNEIVIPVNLYRKYKDAGQEHVFQYINELSEEKRTAFLQQMEGINVAETLVDFYAAKKLLERGQENGSIKFAPLDERSLIRSDLDMKKKFWEKGMEAIRKGKVAALTLAGGQGTRLGSSAPKGCYNIGLPSGASLFKLQALRLWKLASLAGVSSTSIPWYIMTSSTTHTETVEYFKANEFFGLPRKSVTFFKQDELPAISKDGKLILKRKDSLALSPNGNGGLYSALNKERILYDMKRRGVECVHVFGVDNALVRPADPAFIGGCIEYGSDFGNKTIIKTDPKESVGILCKGPDGKMIIAEYSELSSSLAEKRVANGELLFSQANIANHYFTIPLLERI